MESRTVGMGTRLQNGVPRLFGDKSTTPNGLMLKGVVMATYVTDDTAHPFSDSDVTPIAVYCDVLFSPPMPGQSWFTLKGVLVSQKRGGMQDDDIWMPRATTQNINGVLDSSGGANPGLFDGDWVLVGFTNNSFDDPIILRGVPHPSRDLGNTQYPIGKRLSLKLADGNPDFDKYHGTFRGVDSDGNHVVDTTHAHDGTILAGGLEPPHTSSGSGNQYRDLPDDTKHEIRFWNMSSPLTPVEALKAVLDKEGLAITRTGVPPTPDVSAAIADHLQTFYTAFKAIFDAHVHPDGMGGSGSTPTTAANWDTAINSNRLTFPDN